jgi:hypothetical protein
VRLQLSQSATNIEPNELIHEFDNIPYRRAAEAMQIVLK